jgi:chromosome segregation ATPase
VTPEEINSRVNKMAAWATETTKTIKDLQGRLLPSLDEADRIAAELGDLSASVSGVQGDLDEATGQLLDVQAAKRPIEEQLDQSEARLVLNVFSEVNDDGKLAYTKTGPDGKAALVLAKKHDPEYQEASKALRELERKELQYKALIESEERALSEYRQRNRALIARLEYFTARLRQ